MARPKEFDRDEALQGAISVFSDHGFEGTSTQHLLGAMGISRQSLYDTFGDKKSLYLEALRSYSAGSVAAVLAPLRSGGSPIAALEAALVGFASRPPEEAGNGCLGVGSICEFGTSDPDVAKLNGLSGRSLLAAFGRAVEEGKAAGEIAASVDATVAAEFLGATLSGLKVAARGGLPVESLQGIARMAIRSLR
jgi:TetR/AcrR family transcriptional repressor of nem operon